MDVNYENYRKKLGEAIKEKRKERGLSRESLAANIKGVCSKTIENVEKAEYTRDIGLHTIQAICKALNFSVKMTLGG